MTQDVSQPCSIPWPVIIMMGKTFEYISYYDVYGAILNDQGKREYDEQGTQVPAEDIGDHPQAST